MKNSIIIFILLFSIAMSCQKDEVKSNDVSMKALSKFLNVNGFQTNLLDQKSLNVLNVDVNSQDKLRSLVRLFYTERNYNTKVTEPEPTKRANEGNAKTDNISVCSSTTYWYGGSSTLCQTFICLSSGSPANIWTDCSTAWN